MKENKKFVFGIFAIAVVVETFFIIYRQRDISTTGNLSMPSTDYWEVFDKITMERKYVEEAGAHYRLPVFTSELIGLAGTEIALSGYYLPYSRLDSVIIISRYPNASCFYCGNAGIESVAMVKLEANTPSFRTDQRLLVRGKLNLNSTNIEMLAFILEEALIEEL